MAHITTIANQKGGVGKTTTTQSLSCYLTKAGYKTLVIDLDPQCNLSYSFDADQTKAGIYEVLHNHCTVSEIIQTTPNGDIVTGNLLLSSADLEFNKIGKEYMLRDILAELHPIYDYILLDTPPTLGLLTINALTASNDVLIPLGANIYSVQGLGQLIENINGIRKYCNPNLKVVGMLITRYKNTNVTSSVNETLQEMSKEISLPLFDVIIREGISIEESQINKQSILHYAPKSKQAEGYEALTKEYLERTRANG